MAGSGGKGSVAGAPGPACARAPCPRPGVRSRCRRVLGPGPGLLGSPRGREEASAGWWAAAGALALAIAGVRSWAAASRARDPRDGSGHYVHFSGEKLRLREVPVPSPRPGNVSAGLGPAGWPFPTGHRLQAGRERAEEGVPLGPRHSCPLRLQTCSIVGVGPCARVPAGVPV